MSFNLSNLVTVAQCDTYLQSIENDILDLNIEITEEQTEIASNVNLAVNIPSQITSLEEVLEQQVSALAAATETKLQRNLSLMINSLENKLIRLRKRQDNLVGHSVLDKQYSLAVNESELQALTEFKTALEARKVEIQNSANPV